MKRIVLALTLAAFAFATIAPAVFAQGLIRGAAEPTPPKGDVKSGKHTDKNQNKVAPKKLPQ